ncbi:MAG: D-arabinono-1,4-lactone oxidase [Myxococcota bacterium]
MAAGWRNWSGTVACDARVHEATSEEDLARLVRETSARGGVLRAAGTGHSHTALIANGDTVVSVDALAGVRDHDTRAATARIGAGSVLSSLGDPLRERGLALQNMGDVDVQTLAGAVSTGTHGTGRTLGGLATRIAALRLVTASGDVLACDEQREADVFDLARVSLGALGVLSELTLRLVPAYRLHERVSRVPVDETLERFDAWADAHRHCEFFWLPGRDVCEVKRIDATDAAPDPLPDRPYERVDHGYRVLPSVREERFVEMEYAVPAEHGLACFEELRRLMQTRHPEVLWPVEVRTVAADDVPLSPAFGRETMTVSVHQGNELPWREFFADAEVVLRNHQGRPHWGKWHTLGAPELRDLYPRFGDFTALRERLDPHGVFLNEHLRELLGG